MPATLRSKPVSCSWIDRARHAWRAASGAARSAGRGIRTAAAFVARPVVVKGAVSVGILAGFCAGLGAAEKQLKDLPGFRVEPQCLKIREMPPWLAADWTESIPDPFVGGPKNLFEPGLTSRVRAAYEASPWIESVCSVRKEFPDRLRVRLRVRTPLAAVPWDGKLLLVDGHGVRLPKAYTSVPDFGFPLRVLDGVKTPPPPPGRVWASAPLKAGLAVAAVLTGSGRKPLDRIARIDVSRVRPGATPGRTEIVLYAAEGGGPIEWGCAAQDLRFGLEIPVEQKIANLELLLKTCPDMRKLRYALVQFDETTYLPAE
jgi:hypothetical protein